MYVELTNSYTGHYSVLENVYGVLFIQFCSTSREECEKWIARNSK